MSGGPSDRRRRDRRAGADKALELYRLLAENATDMVSTHLPSGAFDYATPSWSEYTGLPSEAICGLLPKDLAHPDDITLLMANYRRALVSFEIITTAWHCRRADGTYGWLETTTRTVRDPDTGDVKTFVCTSRDITVRRHLEEELAIVNGAVLAASAASDFSAAMSATLKQLCNATGWTYGEVWFPAADARTLEHSGAWYARDGFDATAFACERVRLNLRMDEALPGRAWARRNVLWITDLAAQPHAPTRAAADAGFTSAVAVPAMAQGQVVAVLVFFLRDRHPDDERRVHLLTIAAAQLSVLIARKRVEQSLADERRFLDALLDNMTEGIIACNARGRLTLFNRAARQIHGLGPNDPLPQDATERYAALFPDPLTRLPIDRMPLNRAMRGETVRDQEMITTAADGGARIVSASAVPIVDEHGARLGAVVASRDITEWKNAQEALVRSDQRFRAASDSGLDAFIIFEPLRDVNVGIIDFIFSDVNTAATKLLRRRREQLIGRRLTDVLPFTAATGHVQKFVRAMERQETLVDEMEIREPGMFTGWIYQQIVPLSDGVAVTTRDISHRKELERLKGEFVSMVSHELRTPLTSIRGALGLLRSGKLTISPEKTTRMLDVAMSNTERLIRLINDILDVERIESGAIDMTPEWIDAREHANQVIDALRPVADKAGIELRLSGASPRVWADADRLTQTLTNLIGNAIKFSPEGRAVDVRVSAGPEEVLFQVEDRGRGIPADKLESIFERFQQVDASDSREKGGTGLGLAICKSIVKQHGGRIWVESTLRTGSTFYFTLPNPKETARAADAPAEQKPSGMTVLELTMVC